VYHYTPSNQIQPGQYTIHEIQPGGYNDGLDTSDNVTAIPGSDKTDVIPVTVTGPNQSLLSNHFGEMLQAGITGRVYNDVDKSGNVSAPDIGLQFVTITVTGTDVLGNAVSQTTTTDGLGYYAFRTLTAGTYTVTETQPAGYLQGTNTLGTLGGTISGDSMTLTVGCGQTGDNYNFGEILNTPVVPVIPPPQQDTGIPPATPTPPPVTAPADSPFTFSKFFLIGSSWLDM
jgi:hypothetical protein